MTGLGRLQRFNRGPANGRNRARSCRCSRRREAASVAPNRTLAFLWLVRFCRPAVCDAGLHIPDKMVPAAATLKGLHDPINPIDARADAEGGQPRGAAAWSNRWKWAWRYDEGIV